jgi:hypothetical protein
MKENKQSKKRDIRKLPQLVYELSHLRHDPAHCLSGLFRSIKKGERKKTKLDVTYKFGKESLHFVGFEILGVDDMRILQGLVATAGPSKYFVKLDGTAKTDIGRMLATAMDPRDNAQNMYARFARTTIHKLLHEIGYKTDDKKQYQIVKNSIKRMCNVTLFVECPEGSWSSHLMSHTFEEKTGELNVALNPLVTRAILGEVRYTWIDLKEVRLLKTDSARLLHERLCAWIDQGDTKSVCLDKLMGYIWPDKAKPNTIIKRKIRARKAIGEIESVGWVVYEVKKETFSFTRPKVIHVNQEESQDQKSTKEV